MLVGAAHPTPASVCLALVLRMWRAPGRRSSVSLRVACALQFKLRSE
jgi:hypothetical protein